VCLLIVVCASHVASAQRDDDFWDDPPASPGSSKDSDYIGREWEAAEDLAESNIDLENARRYEAQAQEEAARAMELDSDIALPDELQDSIQKDLSDCEFATRCQSVGGSDVADPNNCTDVACYCGMCVDTGIDTELATDCVLVDDRFCEIDDDDFGSYNDAEDDENELSSTSQWLISLTVFAVCSTGVYYLLTQYLQLDATEQERKPLRVQRDPHSSNPNPGPNSDSAAPHMKASYVDDDHQGYGGPPAYGEAPEIEVVDTTYATRPDVEL